MAASTKTPERMATVRRMHAEGASAREVGDAIGVSHTTIAAWLREAGLAPNGGHGSRDARQRVRIPEAEQRATIDVADGEDDLARVNELPIDHIRRRRRRFQNLIDANEAGALTGDFPVPLFQRLCEMEIKFATAEATLLPALPIDPENDPTNQEAADEVRRKLQQLVEQAEETARCPHCGKNPLREAG